MDKYRYSLSVVQKKSAVGFEPIMWESIPQAVACARRLLKGYRVVTIHLQYNDFLPLASINDDGEITYYPELLEKEVSDTEAVYQRQLDTLATRYPDNPNNSLALAVARCKQECGYLIRAEVVAVKAVLESSLR